ncbi:MAG: competence protein ComEA [Alphaproteobacteria bacterium]|jgi:competence protein ComEA
MKLPNWMMLCALLVGGVGQYSVNAVASIPAFSGDFQQLTSQGEFSRSSMASEATIAPIDINKASAQELSALPGIGAKKALAIVEYRELNGKFVSVEELVNVKGIGPKMLAKLDGYVSI